MVQIKKTEPEQEVDVRDRYAYYYQYCQHPSFSVREPLGFKIRQSLADYEKSRSFPPGVYCQRIYILARNVSKEKLLTLQTSEVFVENVSEEELEDDKDDDDEPYEAENEEEMCAPFMEVESDSTLITIEQLDEADKKVNKKVIKKPTKINRKFANKFMAKLQELAIESHKQNVTGNRISGLFLCMGDEFTFLMLEGCEDIIGYFLGQLELCIDDFWVENRIFLLEDLINKIYFKRLEQYETEVVNVNEKFPFSMPDDLELMSEQHFDIKDRLHILCDILSVHLRRPATRCLRKLNSLQSV